MNEKIFKKYNLIKKNQDKDFAYSCKDTLGILLESAGFFFIDEFDVELKSQVDKTSLIIVEWLLSQKGSLKNNISSLGMSNKIQKSFDKWIETISYDAFVDDVNNMKELSKEWDYIDEKDNPETWNNEQWLNLTFNFKALLLQEDVFNFG